MPHRRRGSPQRELSFSSKNIMPAGVVFPRSPRSAATSYVPSAGPVAYSAAAPIYYVPGSAGVATPTATPVGKPVSSAPKMDEKSKEMLERLQREENERAKELKKRETELRAKAAKEAAAMGRKLSPKRPEGAVRADGAAAALGLGAAASGLAEVVRRADVEARMGSGMPSGAPRPGTATAPPVPPRQDKPLAAQSSPLTQPFGDLIDLTNPLLKTNPEDAELFRRIEQGLPLFPASQNVTGAVAGPIDVREFAANPGLLAAFSQMPKIGGNPNPMTGIAFGGGKRKSPKRRSARRSPAAKRRSPRKSPAKRRSARRSPAAKRRSARRSPAAKRRSPRRN